MPCSMRLSPILAPTASPTSGSRAGPAISRARLPANSARRFPAVQDQYLFWDSVHPTAAAHLLAADFAYDTLVATPEPSTWAMLVVGFAGLGLAAGAPVTRRRMSPDSLALPAARGFSLRPSSRPSPRVRGEGREAGPTPLASRPWSSFFLLILLCTTRASVFSSTPTCPKSTGSASRSSSFSSPTPCS